MTDEPVEPDSSAPVVPPLLLGTYNPKIDAKGACHPGEDACAAR